MSEFNLTQVNVCPSGPKPLYISLPIKFNLTQVNVCPSGQAPALTMLNKQKQRRVCLVPASVPVPLNIKLLTVAPLSVT